MDVDKLIELEIRVRDTLAQLEQEIAEGEKAAPPGKLDGTEGRLSRQDSLMHHEIAKNAQQRRLAFREALRATLTRMDEGTYGYCAKCGAPIELERLEACPETLLCAACAGLK